MTPCSGRSPCVSCTSCSWRRPPSCSTTPLSGWHWSWRSSATSTSARPPGPATSAPSPGPGRWWPGSWGPHSYTSPPGSVTGSTAFSRVSANANSWELGRQIFWRVLFWRNKRADLYRPIRILDQLHLSQGLPRPLLLVSPSIFSDISLTMIISLLKAESVPDPPTPLPPPHHIQRSPPGRGLSGREEEEQPCCRQSSDERKVRGNTLTLQHSDTPTLQHCFLL